MSDTLFSGAHSLRVAGERRRLVLTLLFLPLSLGVVGFFFQNTITVHSLVLILIGAMLYVALGRGRFLGGGVRIGPGQFDHVYRIVEECSQLVGVVTPHVFLRDDPFIPIVGVGTGDPYALVFSSQYIELFSEDELRFLIGREIAHVAAGHTKLSSLLSANGRENAVVAVAFGAWLRPIEYTADRVGLLCCGSLATAFSAIAASTFHRVGRKIDMHAFAEQRRELDAEPSLRMGEWLSATPYVTNRIARLAAFARDPLFGYWAARFAERRAGARVETVPLADHDPRRFAGPWRRALALAIDLVVISAVIPSAAAEKSGSTMEVANGAVKVTSSGVHQALADSDVPAVLAPFLNWLAHGGWSITVAVGQGILWLALIGYVIVLVAFAGQTLGMMICDLRVVGDRSERIGLARSIARYVCLLLSLSVVVGFVSALRRVQPFEKWSRTRLVNGNAARP